MSIERRDPESVKYLMYEHARQVAENFLPKIDPDLKVEVTNVTVTPADKEKKKYETVSLNFTHATRPEIKWTMEVRLDDDYLKNDFEKAVRRVYLGFLN